VLLDELREDSRNQVRKGLDHGRVWMLLKVQRRATGVSATRAP
jgi:hypothetical protein